MTIHIVFHVVKLLNFFPPKGGISTTLSPKTILSGETLSYKHHLCLQVGEYCQVHEEIAPRNGMHPRTKGAIALGPSGNIQGGFKFMALDTGKKITRRSWDVIPMPDIVIERVNTLGADQPEQMTFTDRHGRIIGDNDDMTNPINDDFNLIENDVDIPGVDIDEIPGVDIAEITGVDMDNETYAGNDSAPPNADNVDSDNLDTPPPDPSTVAAENTTAAADNTTDVAQPITTQDETRRSTRIRTQTKAYTPGFSGSKYSYAVTQLQNDGLLNPDAHMFLQGDFYQTEPDVVTTIMTQLSLKSGLRQWGSRAYDAAESEMKQLHLRDTFKPMHWSSLTRVQRLMTLESHMFLKEKRDGKIKGRTVAGGNKQRDYISKEDVSSPTVTTESVLLSCIIDAQENRDVAVIDIPNSFIQTRVEDEKDRAIIRLRGVLVEVLENIAPDVHGPYIMAQCLTTALTL
jgi:hypothetical protein